MKVSLINVNLVAEDAIGSCIIHQVRFFQRQGHDVRAYVLDPPHNVPADVVSVTHVVTLADLVEGRQEHFCLSDLYIYHYPGRYELLETIRGIDRGRVIFYYHNVTPPELWGSGAGRELLMRSVEGKALAHYADLCITDSPFNRQDLVENVGYDADRIHLLPLAVPLEEFSPGDKDPELVKRYHLEGQRVLVFVGRMAGNKRIDLLVEALAMIKRVEPNLKLLLVGDDQSTPAFREIVSAARAQAKVLGLTKEVHWTGRVEDLLPYYRLADLYVTASVHEGFGVPLIEAMACGVPVIASRAGAMPWVIGEAGLLAEPGDARDLADKAVMVLRSPDLRQTLVERGLQRAQAFGLKSYEAGLAEIVDSAMTYTVGQPPFEPLTDAEPGAMEPPLGGRNGSLLNALAAEIAAQSDIALRDYRVRSRVPLIGPLIAWVRRNMTSHLREPYLDPMIEKQIALNRQMADWMRRAAAALNASHQRQSDLEARLQTLEAENVVLRRLSAEPAEQQER